MTTSELTALGGSRCYALLGVALSESNSKRWFAER
jgi:hypothetical protein